MFSVKKLALLMSVLMICVGCDQSTKYVAKQYLDPGIAHSIAGDTLRIVYSENAGAFLGMGANLPNAARSIIFTGVVAAILTFLFAYLLTQKNISKVQLLAGALVLGGGFSNFLDRSLNNGMVTDFINLGVGTLRTGIFNLADVAIMMGAVVFIWTTRQAA